MTDVHTVVLVHGGFVDGSGWQGVYEGSPRRLPRQYRTEPHRVPGGRRRLYPASHRRAGRPARAGGHSYGGAVITAAGLHEAVAALVYIAAFAPDKDESVNTLIAGFPPDGPQPPILPPRDGFLFLGPGQFHASFAGDLAAADAAFMADSQVPWGVDALGGTISEAAWRTKPSWYLHVTDDRMIPPSAQRAMAERTGATITEAPASHAVYVSQPQAVASLIKQAAG